MAYHLYVNKETYNFTNGNIKIHTDYARYLMYISVLIKYEFLIFCNCFFCPSSFVLHSDISLALLEKSKSVRVAAVNLHIQILYVRNLATSECCTYSLNHYPIVFSYVTYKYIMYPSPSEKCCGQEL